MRVGEEGELRPIVPREMGHVAVSEASDQRESAREPSSRLSVDETDTVRLMHELHSTVDGTRTAAATELMSRGFTKTHLNLARQLTSPKPEVRAAVASELPNTRGIDARLWLTWLMRDEKAEVRIAAISVLATTGDSDSLRRAIEIARQDRDPRVRKLLERMQDSQR